MFDWVLNTPLPQLSEHLFDGTILDESICLLILETKGREYGAYAA